MEVIKEGLKQYLVGEDIDNSYFLSFEYEMIHQNQIDEFLIMQLREKNGKKYLLYDITGSRSLEEVTQEKNLEFSVCRELVKSVKNMLCVLENYMLRIEHVSFTKDSIYLTQEEKIKFLYYPNSQFSIKEDLEEFFAWLLSKIDYEDKKCVQLAYLIYNQIRKKGISEEMLDEILKETSVPKSRIEKESSMTTTIKPPVVSEKKEMKSEVKKATNKTISKSREKKKKGVIEKVISRAGMLMSGVGFFYFAIAGWRYGYAWNILKYMLGSGCFLLFFFLLGKSFQKKENQHIISQLTKSSVSNPGLKDLDTGELYYINHNPYYIGSKSGDNHLVIKLPVISRHHAMIFQKESGEYMIRDLSSTNGTCVNHKKIEEGAEPLAAGSILEFAGHSYQFVLS